MPLFEETVKLRRAKLGPTDPAVLDSMNELAFCYYQLGRASDAIPLAEEAARLRKAALGPSHDDTLNSMQNLGLAYHIAGKPDQGTRRL